MIDFMVIFGNFAEFFFWILRGFYLGVPSRSGYTKRPPRRSILLSLTRMRSKGLKSLQRFLLFISFIYPLLLRFSYPANVLNLANFISPNAVLIGYVAGKPNTKLADSQYRASFHFARLFSSLFWLRLKKALS